MKKILFSVLVLCLITGCGEKKEDVVLENNEIVNNEADYTKYIPNGDTLDKIIEKEVTLNGTKYKVALVYSYKKTDVDNWGDKCNTCYKYNVTLIYNNKAIETNTIDNKYYDSYEVSYSNEENIKIIKDNVTNEEYLVVYYPKNGEYKGGEVAVLSENGKIVYDHEEVGGWKAFVLDNSKYIGLEYIELKDNYISLTTITASDAKDSVHKVKVTIESGEYKLEKTDITGDISLGYK